ncbi:hypothetical protein Ancab_017033 [Ancistrocladus abbreviatus]
MQPYKCTGGPRGTLAAQARTERCRVVSGKSVENISEASAFNVHAERETARFRAKKGKVVRVLERETVRKGAPEEDAGHEKGTGSPLGRVDFGLPNGTVGLLGAVGPDFLISQRQRMGQRPNNQTA